MFKSTSAFLQTMFEYRRPTPLISVKAYMILRFPSTFVFNKRRMCWNCWCCSGSTSDISISPGTIGQILNQFSCFLYASHNVCTHLVVNSLQTGGCVRFFSLEVSATGAVGNSGVRDTDMLYSIYHVDLTLQRFVIKGQLFVGCYIITLSLMSLTNQDKAKEGRFRIPKPFLHLTDKG